MFGRSLAPKKIINEIANYANQCPKCHSPNIVESDNTMVCQNCSHHFVDEDFMNQIQVVSWLKNTSRDDEAQQIAEMNESEYNRFLNKYIYE